MKFKQLLVAAVLVSAIFFAGAGSAVANLSPYLHVSKVNTYTGYSWVYFNLVTSGVVDSSTYYYCRVYDSDVLNTLLQAQTNNFDIRMNCAGTWQTDSSRLCDDTVGPKYYECSSVYTYPKY